MQRSNADVGGRLIEMAETEFMVRGRGRISSIADIESIVVDAQVAAQPVQLREVASVEIGPDIKRGIAEKNGRGEVVAGIVTMRYGANALSVIRAVKEKIRELGAGLPPGVVISKAYDRSGLIERSVTTLTRQLIEELLVVVLVCVLFLWHARSALVSVVVLPLGILASFVVMRALNMSANIMSLGGIAIAIGTMVDASVVMIENLHKHKEAAREEGNAADHWELVRRALARGGAGALLLAARDHGLVPAGLRAGGPGGPAVQTPGPHQDAGDGLRGGLDRDSDAGLDGPVREGNAAAREREPC